MSKSLFDISSKIDRNTVEAIETINRVANTHDISYFAVGAFARDLLLEHIYNMSPYRATLDMPRAL